MDLLSTRTPFAGRERTFRVTFQQGDLEAETPIDLLREGAPEECPWSLARYTKDSPHRRQPSFEQAGHLEGESSAGFSWPRRLWQG